MSRVQVYRLLPRLRCHGPCEQSFASGKDLRREAKAGSLCSPPYDGGSARLRARAAWDRLARADGRI